ncbi:helix-turn-helix domain-containing protein [Haloactinopolyspora sp.]|uniref:helix-turn-helix domain-containing protein n=1 Tax=Haloactinopolyspora sp. TaxID=1966353 RepID=UPI0026036778|nr:helix-turn-helix domain-containing protein [Haloactinopolyspora sp.]
MGTELEGWDRPEIRDALRAGDWAPVLRMVLDAGFSQTEIAARAGISQAHVSRLTTGRSRDPGIATIRALCDGLGIPRRLAGLTDNDQGGDDTDRRQFIATTVGAAASAVVAAQHADDDRLVMLTTLSYRQIEQTTPARAMLAAATGHLNLARQLAERATGQMQARMFGAVSEAAGLVAWLHADTVNLAVARANYRLAVDAARRTGNPLLPVYMQASLGQYAVTVGDARQGLRLIRESAARLPNSAPATARAWLAAADAVALAHLGDAAAWGMLDEAERYAEAGQHEEPVWPWVFRFDQAKIDQSRVVAASRLGCRSALPSSAPGARSPKQSAVAMVEHARALAAGGDVDEACRIAADAHQLGTRYGSERVRLAVRDFRSAVRADTASVRELDDLMFDTYGERQ